MEFQPTRLPEVILIKPRVFSDARGHFFETWHGNTFANAGIGAAFVQDNHSHSIRNTLRGLHFQIEQPQGKLVRVYRGEVFDVAVDIRRSSPHFGQWVGVTLSEANHHMLWVPPGFAHGYLVISEETDFVYLSTSAQTITLRNMSGRYAGMIWSSPLNGHCRRAPLRSCQQKMPPRLH
jgi:dTDP-4-dehydrorhamnose 3,5-epimerase